MAALDTNLHQVRRQILARTALLQFKKAHVDGPGQKHNMRARSLVNCVTAKLDRWVGSYRRARTAAESLDPCGDWQKVYQPLLDSDIKPLTKEESTLGVGFREIGWIWLVQRFDCQNAGEGVDNTLVHTHESTYRLCILPPPH